MCTSTLHRVLGDAGPGVVLAEDVDGGRHDVSLLALDGPPPEPGTWLVVHSGYAIDRMEPEQAEAVLAELRRAVSGPAQSEGDPAWH